MRIRKMFSTCSIGKISSLAVLLGVLAATPAAGQFVQDPPPELTFLSTVLKVRKNIRYETWGEVKFPKGDGPYKQGKHWFILAETANCSDPVTEWNKIKPAFLQNGWTLFKESRGADCWRSCNTRRMACRSGPTWIPTARRSSFVWTCSK